MGVKIGLVGVGDWARESKFFLLRIQIKQTKKNQVGSEGSGMGVLQ